MTFSMAQDRMTIYDQKGLVQFSAIAFQVFQIWLEKLLSANESTAFRTYPNTQFQAANAYNSPKPEIHFGS